MTTSNNNTKAHLKVSEVPIEIFNSLSCSLDTTREFQDDVATELSEEAQSVKKLLDSFTLVEKIKWLKSSLPINSFEINILLLEEIEKINRKQRFKFKHQFIFFDGNFFTYFANLFDDYLFPLFKIASLIVWVGLITLGLVFQPSFIIALTVFFVIGYIIALCKTEARTPLEILRCWADFYSLPWVITSFLITIPINVISSTVIACFMCSQSKEFQALIPNQNVLLAHCIDDYFEGKADIFSEKLINLFNQYLNKKRVLTEKEIAFKQVIDAEKKNIYFSRMTAKEIWQNGVESWQHYRYLRQSNDLVMQCVLTDLLETNQLFTGSTAPFDQLARIENYSSAFNKAKQTIENNQALVKVVMPEDWSLFIKQCEDVHVQLPSNATSITLLSSQLNTPFAGEQPNLPAGAVGFLFDQEKCKVKTRFLQASGAYAYGWVVDDNGVGNYRLDKDGLLAIVITSNTPEARRLAISRQTEIKCKFSIFLPIIFYDSSQKLLSLYEWQEILDDKLLDRDKQDLLKIHQACLEKDWKVGFFNRNSVSDKFVPRTIDFLDRKILPLKRLDKENSYYDWALLKQKIKQQVTKKSQQNNFFRILNGCSPDTVEFYQTLLKTL